MKYAYYVFNLKVSNSRIILQKGNIDTAYMEDLNEIHKEGWELITVDDGMAYFKKPLQNIFINDNPMSEH